MDDITRVFRVALIVAVVAFGIYWTQSAWCLWGLIFCPLKSVGKIETECPSCHLKFTAVEKCKEPSEPMTSSRA